MSVSLYYTAKRDYPITKQEQEAYQKVVDHYIEKYPFGDMYEGFCVYDLDKRSEENVIFEGATKLPINQGEAHLAKVHDYWTACLQEIVLLLPNAQWYIHIDDMDITQYFDLPT